MTRVLGPGSRTATWGDGRDGQRLLGARALHLPFRPPPHRRRVARRRRCATSAALDSVARAAPPVSPSRSPCRATRRPPGAATLPGNPRVYVGVADARGPPGCRRRAGRLPRGGDAARGRAARTRRLAAARAAARLLALLDRRRGLARAGGRAGPGGAAVEALGRRGEHAAPGHVRPRPRHHAERAQGRRSPWTCASSGTPSPSWPATRACSRRRSRPPPAPALGSIPSEARPCPHPRSPGVTSCAPPARAAAPCSPRAAASSCSLPPARAGRRPRADPLAELVRRAPRARYWVSTASADCAACHAPGYAAPPAPQPRHRKPLVRCQLCARSCVLAEGERGALPGAHERAAASCAAWSTAGPWPSTWTRSRRSRSTTSCPGAAAYSLATAGCPLRCKFCQNWEISQARPEDYAGDARAARGAIARAAAERGAPVIAFTYNEPTVFIEYLTDIARAAQAARACARCWSAAAS